MGGDKEIHSKREWVLLCLGGACSYSFVLLLLGEHGRVFKEIVGLTSQEMKYRAPDRAVTKKSMVPVLKHMYAHSCADSLYKQCLRHLPRYWQGSLGAAASSQLVLRSSTPYCGDFITLWFLEHSVLHFHKSSLFVSFCQLVHSFLVCVTPSIPLHFQVFSFLLSHSLPPYSLQLNKQTNPLPLDTQRRRGDLLCLSGRILSDIVAPVNKKKAPEAGRGSLIYM